MGGPRLILWVWLVWFMAVMTAVASGSFASSTWRNGRLEGDVIESKVTAHGLITCLSLCEKNSSCRSLNYQQTTKTCELLSSALCDGNDTYSLNRDDNTWRYFDLMDYPTQEDDSGLLDRAVCTEFGKCSSKCERGVNRTCTHSDQCSAVDKNSHCTATPTAPIGICECNIHYWGYNASLCIHQISYSTPIRSWIFKRIVNDMCDVTFTVKAYKGFELHLLTREDWHGTVPNYKLGIGIGFNTITKLERNGVLINQTDTIGLLTNDFQNFTLSWCDGKIRFGKQGMSNLIEFDDPNPLLIKGIGFRINVENYLFFPHNLVDPDFPSSVETRSIRTNGHHWHQMKILPDASETNNISFIFECKAYKNCDVLFGKRFDHSHKYQVAVGGNGNEDTKIYNQRTNSWVTTVSTPSIVSPTEFRKFWITISGPTIKVGRDDDATPIATYTDPVNTPTFTHVSINTCCGQWGYFRIHSHPQFHEYPNGGYDI